MIKFEYIPWTAERTWGYAEDVPPVESVTMTLGDDVTWQEATDEFHNFLRAAGYVIPYDFEDEKRSHKEFLQDLDDWAMDESNTDVAEVERLRAKKKQIYEDLKEALEEAVYLLNPTDEDMQKKAGVYRVVTALEKLKDKNV